MSKSEKSISKNSPRAIFSIESAEVFLASKNLSPAMFEMESIFLHFGRCGYGWFHWWAHDVFGQETYGFCANKTYICQTGTCDGFSDTDLFSCHSIKFPIKINNLFFWTVASKALEQLTTSCQYEFITSVKETFRDRGEVTLRATGLKRKEKSMVR